MTPPPEDKAKELEPCPFCGESVKVFQNLKDGNEGWEECTLIDCYTVIHDCKALMGQIIAEGPTELSCVRRWNTRPETAALNQEQESGT